MQWQLRMSHRDSQGNTTMSKLQSVARQLGRTPPELIPPESGYVANQLLAWFWELNTTRMSSGFGPQPLQYGQLRDWMQVMGWNLNRAMIRCLLVLDDEYMRAAVPKQTKAVKSKGVNE